MTKVLTVFPPALLTLATLTNGMARSAAAAD